MLERALTTISAYALHSYSMPEPQPPRSNKDLFSDHNKVRLSVRHSSYYSTGFLFSYWFDVLTILSGEICTTSTGAYNSIVKHFARHWKSKRTPCLRRCGNNPRFVSACCKLLNAWLKACRYCQIALAYSDTPDLRATWLSGLASLHEKSENYAEAAVCKMHVAALVADYLEQSGRLSNCKNFDNSIFSSICPGISESAVSWLGLTLSQCIFIVVYRMLPKRVLVKLANLAYKVFWIL